MRTKKGSAVHKYQS